MISPNKDDEHSVEDTHVEDTSANLYKKAEVNKNIKESQSESSKDDSKRNVKYTMFRKYLYMGVGSMILLIIACFLPGITHATIGETWGFEYYKEITFIWHNLRIKSFVQFLWIVLLMGGIWHCLKGRSERGSQIAIIFMSAILGLAMLVRTYDYANNPSKLVFTNPFAKRVEINIAGSKSIKETSVFGFKARKITYDRSFPLGDGFWFMLVVVAVQLLIAFKLWNIESQIKSIEEMEKE